MIFLPREPPCSKLPPSVWAIKHQVGCKNAQLINLGKLLIEFLHTRAFVCIRGAFSAAGRGWRAKRRNNSHSRVVPYQRCESVYFGRSHLLFLFMIGLRWRCLPVHTYTPSVCLQATNLHTHCRWGECLRAAPFSHTRAAPDVCKAASVPNFDHCAVAKLTLGDFEEETILRRRAVHRKSTFSLFFLLRQRGGGKG